MMYLKKLALIINIFLVCLINFTVSRIDVYKGSTEISFGCDLELTEPFSCVCLSSGLWKIWESCTKFEYFAVINKRCFSVLQPIKRIEKVTTNTSILSVTNPFRSIDFDSNSKISLQNDDTIIMHGVKTVSDGMNEICLSDVGEAYCIYNLTDLLTSVVSVKPGCKKGLITVKPIKCFTPAPDLQKCPQDYSQLQGNLPGSEAELDSSNDLTRQKRMFLPLAVNATPFANADDTFEHDEDFWNEANATEKQSDLFVTSEIWNHLDQRTNQILKTGKLYMPKYKVPVFKILELSKQIAQKICPPWYVHPEFYDMTVHAFVGLIAKRKFFMELKNDYDGFMNIERNLNACLTNATQFKLERFLNDTCLPQVPEGTYTFQVNVSQVEINISQKDMSDYYDPIIDTVWQVVYSIHQYCFPFFNQTESVNDHHRYSVMMESLFQSPIYDIWVSGNTTSGMFDGLLGDLQSITRRSTYCTTLARIQTGFETGLDYPYDLRRPELDPEYNQDKKKRRKRRSNSKEEITRGDAAFCYNSQSQTCTDY